jgi:hypothetical protein
MTPQLDSKLAENYPKIFGKLGYTECSDGWYDIIDVLCWQIQNYVDHKIRNSQMTEEEQQNLQAVAVQVKSKFGGLRFYVYGGDETIDGMIRMAEAMSYRVCEYCSNKARQQNNDGWIHTACSSCFDNRIQRKKTYEED